MVLGLLKGLALDPACNGVPGDGLKVCAAIADDWLVLGAPDAPRPSSPPGLAFVVEKEVEDEAVVVDVEVNDDATDGDGDGDEEASACVPPEYFDPTNSCRGSVFAATEAVFPASPTASEEEEEAEGQEATTLPLAVGFNHPFSTPTKCFNCDRISVSSPVGSFPTERNKERLTHLQTHAEMTEENGKRKIDTDGSYADEIDDWEGDIDILSIDAAVGR